MRRGYNRGFRRGRGGRGRGRGGRGRRGRGGYRKEYRMSRDSENQIRDVSPGEILTNFLPLKIVPESVTWVYSGSLPRGFRLKNTYAERFLFGLFKKKISERFGDDEFIVSELSLISTRMLKEVRDLKLTFYVPHHHLEVSKKAQLNYDSEEEISDDENEEEQGEEEVEGESDPKNKGKIRVTVGFETECLSTEGKDATRLCQVYTNILKNFIEEGRLFHEEYRVYDDRYVEKRPYETSKSHRKGKIEDYFLDKDIHKAFSVGITKREKSWYLVIKPSWKITKIYPNGLDLIDKFIDFGYNNRQISNHFRGFKIRKLAYRRLFSGEMPITHLNFDLKAGDRVDFKSKDPNDTFIDYIFNEIRYREKIERTTKLKKRDMEARQPVFEIKKNERIEKFIPQLSEVNCCLQDENGHLQPFVTSVTNNGGLKQYLDRIMETIQFFRSVGLDQSLRKFGIEISLDASLEKVRPKMVQETKLTDQRGNRFHRTEDYGGFKWQKKMRHLRISNQSGAQDISFDHIMFMYHIEARESAQDLFNQVVVNCQQRQIPFDQDSLFECDYTNDTPPGEWQTHIDKFERKFKRLPKIIFVVTSLYQSNDELYSDLVSFSAENGIVEQFCRGQTAKTKPGRMIGFNLFLQIYCKLGGFLWKCKFASRSFFPKESNTLIVGVTCLRQPQRKFVIYEEENNEVDRKKGRDEQQQQKRKRRGKRIQKVYPTLFCAVAVCPREEWSRRITFLLPFSEQEISGSAMKRAMNFFLGEWTRDFDVEKRPETSLRTIVIYRSGIPHSKFEKCRTTEVRVLENMLKPRDINFVYSIVQKRLNAIFFNNEGDNPPCGSIVDENVTFCEDVRKSFYISLDFFLISTESKIHTTRPCHFVLLHDDVKEEEQFKQLCFECCALYFNFPGCIKVPFSLQLADRLAKKCSRTLFYKDKDDHIKLNVRFEAIHLFDENSKLKEATEYPGDRYEYESFVKVVFHENANEAMFEL